MTDAWRIRGEDHHAAKLTEAQVREIKTLALHGTLTQWEIAKQFGVSQATVWWIKRSLHWKHLWENDATTENEDRGEASTATVE